MKKLLLFQLCFPLLIFGQLNVGNDQTICSADIVQVIANTSIQPSTDSYEVTNITFAPEAISGTPISLSDDDVQGPFPIGFTFQFYGNNYTDFYAGSNGWISFSSGQSTTTVATPIPDSVSISVPRNSIMLSWQDLNPATGGQVLYQTIGTAPNRKLVLTFDAVPYYSTTIPITCQVVLYEGNNVIDNHIIDRPLHTVNAVQGIHNLLGTSATVVPGRNYTVWSANQESVRYFPSGVSWYNANTGQMIGNGDTLLYAPNQSTFISGVITDSTGQVFTDTMYVEVLNTNISTTGLSLCNGPLILTAQAGFSTYNWSGGPSTTAVLTVNSAGVYYVDYVTSNGLSCQSDPISIYSGNIPITLSTPDSLFICQGDTVEINSPLSFSTYNWSTGATTSSITTTLTGNYSLSVVDGNGCTGTSNTTSISISPQTITANTTGSSLCNGPVTLDAGSGFAIYQWYNNNVLITGSISQNLIVTTAGAYHCEIVYPTGCTAISNTLSIVAGTGAFNVIISAIGADSLCEPNGQVILDAGNYASFVWNTNETTQQISVNTLGSYSVDVVDAGGCQGSSNISFEVFDAVNTSVISGPTNPTQFQTVNYSVLSSLGSTYDWTVIGGTIQSGLGTNSIDIMWNNSGTFSLTVIETDINGCLGEEIIIIVSIIISSIEEINNTKILKKITDVLGKETKKEHNTLLFYIYDDGTVEKKISIE
jgi:hypothetical protein